MRSQAFLFSLLALAGGCHHGKHELADGGVDMSGPPVPEAALVSPPAVAVGLMTDATNEHALYIANPTASSGGGFGGKASNGPLHLVDTMGNDAIVSTAAAGNVAVGGYLFSPDGKYVVFGKLSSDGQTSNLAVASVAAPTAGTVVVSADVIFGSFITQIGFFSPDGRYFIFGDGDQGLNGSLSLLVLDVQASPPAIVYEMKNGAFDGTQLVANGVLYYTALSSATTPVMTLYSVPLAGLTPTTMPTTVVERAAAFNVSADSSALYYITASGDVFAQGIDAKGAKGAPTQITPPASTTAAIPAPVAAQYAEEPCSAEPCRVAWASPDGAVHVNLAATEVYKTAAGAIDPNSPLSFTPDGSLFYFQYVKTQESRGILYYSDLSAVKTAATTTTSTPTAVFGTVTGLDDATYDSVATNLFSVIGLGGGTLLAQQNLPAVTSAFGTVFAPLVVSGSPLTTLGMNVPTSEMTFGASDTLAFLSGAVNNSGTTRRITGAQRYGGTLELSSYKGPAKSILANPMDVVASGNYAFSDDNKVLSFIEQTVSSTGVFSVSKAAFDYVGTMHVYDVTGTTGDHPITIPGAADSAAVTEIGPLVSRAGFFLATPTEAAAQGVYHLTY